MKKIKLAEVCDFVQDRISVSNLSRENYISTENLLPNKGGIATATTLPKISTTPAFFVGDILISNIRQYFKKIWYAKFDGGCSNDILVLRAKENIDSKFLYYVLSEDRFFDFATATSKGTKMPRGDKLSIMNYPVPDFPLAEQKQIGEFLYALDEKISLNKKINATLEEMAKLIYKYWFVQFDFPDENGKPYKTSGGEMIFNEQLGREIPAGWQVCRLSDLLTKNNIPFDYATTERTIDLSVMPSSSIVLDKINSSDMFSTNLFKMTEGDILFGSIRPYLKKAGIAPCDGVFAGTVHSYKVKKVSDYNFALFTLCRDSFFDYAVKMSTGTKMPIVSNENLLSYKVVYSESVMKLFNNIAIKDTICKNIQESLKLAELRDFLLPLLLNGQAKFIQRAE